MKPGHIALALGVLAVGVPALAKPVPSLVVSSPDLPAGKAIPELFAGKEFGCNAGGQSPAIEWSGAPAGTKSFMITMFDPAHPPQSGWWHWLVADIPASEHMLPRSAGNVGGPLPAGARLLRPDGDNPQARYYGPCPDVGDPAHHYVITVYALDVAKLDVPETSTPANIDYTAVGHVIAKGRIVRDYARPVTHPAPKPRRHLPNG